MNKIKILVNGALGKMGQQVVKAVLQEPELELVAQIDMNDDLAAEIKKTGPDAVID